MEIILLSAPIIDQLLIDERFNQLPAFKNPPFLPVVVNTKPERWRKPCCGQRKPQPPPSMLPPQVPQLDYNQIKLRIYNTPPADKKHLRELLGCDLVVMQFKDQLGKLMRDEF
jgi:hypothetical protein